MGQLIKLQDYISRYETDVYRYPSQFIRQKKQQWEHVKSAWETNSFHLLQVGEEELDESDWFDRDRKPFLKSLKQLFSRRKKDNNQLLSTLDFNNINQNDDLEFFASSAVQPNSLEELKLLFLENLFHFQIRWASSTIREKSFVSREYYFDENLKYFLQRFPDTFLVLYKPILLLKSAPIEVDIILITPLCTYCVTFLEGENNSVFLGSKERFWTEKTRNGDRKVLNPLISLHRMEKIVKKLYQYHEVDMPIRNVVLNRIGYIDNSLHPYDVDFIEKRNYESWFQSLRKTNSPLKHIQLKAAQALLIHSQTSCVKRLEWEDADDDQFDF